MKTLKVGKEKNIFQPEDLRLIGFRVQMYVKDFNYQIFL